MKTLILISIVFTISQAFYVIETLDQCNACQAANNDNYVCRNNFFERVSYCCENDADNEIRNCKNSNFCTNSVKDVAMEAVTCPYQRDNCGYSSSKVVLSEVNTITSLKLQDRFQYRFSDASICYYEIYADNDKFQLDQADFKITVIFKQIDNVLAQVVNGTSHLDAKDSQIISYQRIHTFDAINNHIFVILEGQEDEEAEDLKEPGEFEIEIDFWLNAPPEQEVVIKEKQEDGSIEQVTIVNKTVTEVIVIWTEPQEKQRIPQTKFTILICCFVSSIVLYQICTWCGKNYSKKRKVKQIQTEAMSTQDVYTRTMSILIRRDVGIALDEINIESDQFDPNMETVMEQEKYGKQSQGNDSIELPKLEFDINLGNKDIQLSKKKQAQSEIERVAVPTLNLKPTTGKAIKQLALSEIGNLNAKDDQGLDTRRELLENDNKEIISKKLDSLVVVSSSNSKSVFQVHLSVKDGSSHLKSNKDNEQWKKNVINNQSTLKETPEVVVIPDKGSLILAEDEEDNKEKRASLDLL